MIDRIRSRPGLTYIVALIGSTGAVLADAALVRTGLTRDLFVLSYGAVALSAWLGGLGPGILAIVTSSIVAAGLLLPTAGSLAVQLDDLLRICIFALIALLTSSLLTRERQARRQVEHALRERTDLMAVISHDLKNPLTAIRARAQLLRRQATQSNGGSSDQLLEGLAAIEDAAKQVTEQLDELVETARLRAGRDAELNRTRIDLVSLTQQLLSQHRASASHRLIFHADAKELVGMWDRARLTRVIENLLTNAIKYSPEEREIRIYARREGNCAVLEVADQGVGIPAQDLPHVFEQFHRASNAPGVATGSGVGLASARHIVEQHGGRISVESQEGAGSTFTVYLPLVPEGNRDECNDRPPPAPWGAANLLVRRS